MDLKVKNSGKVMFTVACEDAKWFAYTSSMVPNSPKSQPI